MVSPPPVASGGRPRLAGLVEGDPNSALSFVPHFLLEALDKRFPVIARVDYGCHGFQRMALAALTFRASRASWRARFHTSVRAHRALSRNLRKRAAAIGDEFDVAIQVFGWASGQPRPYVIYVDQTRLMAEAGWPRWLPLSKRERHEILALEKRMYVEATHLFTMGTRARESLLGDYGLPPDQVTVVGGGANFEALPAVGHVSRNPQVLFVGRDFERKGGDLLIDAFRMVRQRIGHATLQITGVTSPVSASGVTAWGKLPHARIRELYRQARVFCMPSRYEPWGLAFIEAMAHGVPCIGTTVDSLPDILDGGRAGLLVPPDEPEALADALVQLLTDDDLAQRLGVAGRKRVEEQFTWDHVVERMSVSLELLSRARVE